MDPGSDEAIVRVSVVKAQGIVMERTSLYVEVVAHQHDEAQGLPMQGDYEYISPTVKYVRM